MKLKSIAVATVAAAALVLVTPNLARADHRDKAARSLNATIDDENSCPCDFNKASHLIGMAVKNEKGEKLGKVKDVVLNLNSGEVAYVVLAKSGAKKGTGKYLAVSLNDLSPSANQKFMVMDAEKEQIRSADGFARNQWPAMDSTAYGAPSSQPDIIILEHPVQNEPNDDQKKDQPDDRQEYPND